MPDWFQNSPPKVKTGLCLSFASVVGIAVGFPYLAWVILAVAFLLVLSA